MSTVFRRFDLEERAAEDPVGEGYGDLALGGCRWSHCDGLWRWFECTRLLIEERRSAEKREAMDASLF